MADTPTPPVRWWQTRLPLVRLDGGTHKGEWGRRIVLQYRHSRQPGISPVLGVSPPPHIQAGVAQPSHLHPTSICVSHSTFMQEALTNPLHGYYTTRPEVLGETGAHAIASHCISPSSDAVHPLPPPSNGKPSPQTRADMQAGRQNWQAKRNITCYVHVM